MTEGFQIVTVPDSFVLTSHDGMLADLLTGYEVMSGMVFSSVQAL